MSGFSRIRVNMSFDADHTWQVSGSSDERMKFKGQYCKSLDQQVPFLKFSNY